jgi:hypothetical protein
LIGAGQLLDKFETEIGIILPVGFRLNRPGYEYSPTDDFHRWSATMADWPGWR